jgi:effector-binding domain-containing protein
MKNFQLVFLFIFLTTNFLLIGPIAFSQNQSTTSQSFEIEVIEVPEVLVFSVKKEIQDFSQELPQLIHNSVVELTKMGGKPAGPLIVLYYLENVDFNQTLGKILTEVAWPVDNAQYSNNQLPKIKAARIMFKGPYQGMNAVYQSVHSWLVQNHYKIVYPTREIYHNDPATTPAEELLTEILIPVEELKE